MNYIEDHFAELIASDPLRPSSYEGRVDDFDTVTEFSNMLAFMQNNPHKFIKMIKMAEIILSVRDIMWQETEGHC